MITECVYRHTAPDGRMYIGIAQEPAQIRWANGKGYKTNPEFWKCICEVGWDAIKHEILASGLDKRDAMKLEQEYIDLYGTLAPNGFNRSYRDSPLPKRKLEYGVNYGANTVVDYWADADGQKVYRLRCGCGRFYDCYATNLSNDSNCGCRT